MLSVKVPGNSRVTGVKDVSADLFIKQTAKLLSECDSFEVPDWLDLCKSASARELAPYDKNFIYIRAASILRKLACEKSYGVGILARFYGGKKRNGVAPNHAATASKKIIRHCLQQLEKMNFVEQRGSTKNRFLTPKGQTAVDQIARQCVSN